MNVYIRGGGSGSIGIDAPIKALRSAGIQVFRIAVVIRNDRAYHYAVFQDHAFEALVRFQGYQTAGRKLCLINFSIRRTAVFGI